MAAALSAQAKALMDDQAFATVATVGRDGRPQQTVVWIKTDGDDLVFSTVRGRVKARNLERNPGVSVLVIDPRDTARYVAVRGRATLSDDGGPELIQELSRRYTGEPYGADGADAVRTVVRITPDSVFER
ncbi:MAG: PPOX class F420-dependent oxidoreductase [Mycobacteriales bacterium]